MWQAVARLLDGYQPSAVLDAPCLLVRSDNQDGHLGWDRWSSNLTVVAMDTTHAGMIREPGVGVLARLIQEALGASVRPLSSLS